jgi:hypothetical protein
MDFYSNCSAELTSNANQAVQRTYDVLYILTPMKQAVCSKDDNGTYCATEISSSSSSGGNVLLAAPPSFNPQYLVETANGSPASKRDQAALVPNTTTYASSNLVFLFLQPSTSSATLCKTCTRNIMTPYMTFEAGVPYGPGLANSLLLSGQSALYNAIQQTCGKDFLSGSVAAAGGIKNGLLSGSPRMAVADSVLGTLSAFALAFAVVF